MFADDILAKLKFINPEKYIPLTMRSDRLLIEKTKKEFLCVTPGISPCAIRLGEIPKEIKKASKFKLTKSFTEISLRDLSTPDTVAEAKKLFKLPYPYIWLEWSEENIDLGMLLADASTVRAVYGENELLPAAVYACLIMRPSGADQLFDSDGKQYSYIVSEMFFNPSSLKYNTESGYSMDISYPMATEDLTLARTYAYKTIEAVDFIIRINSPKIVKLIKQIPGNKVNAKRVKNGKLPLHSFTTVEISDEIKRYIRTGPKEKYNTGDRRFHQRRGHYKMLTKRVKTPGLYWWNPHTAGRKELGEVEHDYKVDISNVQR